MKWRLFNHVRKLEAFLENLCSLCRANQTHLHFRLTNHWWKRRRFPMSPEAWWLPATNHRNAMKCKDTRGSCQGESKVVYTVHSSSNVCKALDILKRFYFRAVYYCSLQNTLSASLIVFSCRISVRFRRICSGLT